MTVKTTTELQDEAAEATRRELHEHSKRNRMRAVGCILLGVVILGAIVAYVLSNGWV